MHTLKKGILISIEGIDGSGKSTLAKNLGNSLSAMHYPVLHTKEPGDTQLGAQLRAIVQEKKVPICPIAEFLLFATDRAQHFEQIIIPQLQQNKLIICDRMSDSSIAYQGYGRGLAIPMIKAVNQWAMHGIQADLTIYVRVTAQIAMARILARNLQLTSFEKEKQEFIQRLITGFDDLYKDRNDVIIVDGTQSPDTLTTQTTTALIAWITKKQLQA